MNINKVVKLFENGSVSVCGMRGKGKDMLTANVIARRKTPHISNCPYTPETIPFDYSVLDIGNTYKDFIEGTVKPYVFPYPDGTDIYLSDCGVYFPAQYCNELNRDYKAFPAFIALSRHLFKGSVHFNSQDIGRPWDKLKEQSDVFIMCLWCKVICGFVFQKIRIYERFDACKARVQPCRIHKPLICLDPDRRLQIQMYLDNYANSHGMVKEHFLIYRNRSNYDTRFFRTLLAPKNNL